MKNVRRKAGFVAAGLALSQSALADYASLLQVSMGQATQGVFQLNNFIMLVCMTVFVAVFGAMFYSLLRHRKSAGSQAVHFHSNTMVELVWTAIPFVILMSVAYPATKTVIDHQSVGAVQAGEQRLASR